MSRVIKSEHCIEALPCRLGPVEGDAFFISNRSNDEEGESILPQNADLDLMETTDSLLAQAKDEADRIIVQAQAEAAALLDKARFELERLKAEAVLNGRNEGLTQIYQEMTGQLAAALEVFKETENQRETRLWESESELLKLSVLITEKIIGAELEQNPDCQVGIVKQALSHAVGSTNILIRVHPDFLAVISAASSKLQKVFNEPRAIQFEPDPHLEPGDCFIETEQGNVDARIQSQLERILTELYKVGQAR